MSLPYLKIKHCKKEFSKVMLLHHCSPKRPQNVPTNKLHHCLLWFEHEIFPILYNILARKKRLVCYCTGAEMKKKLHIVQFSYNKHYNFISISCIKIKRKLLFLLQFKINKFDVEVRCQNSHIAENSKKNWLCSCNYERQL